MLAGEGAVARKIFSKSSNLVVQLGRFGDIINLLPVAQEEFRKGRRMKILCAKEFASVLDGVSYVDVEVWDGPYTHVKPALIHAKAESPNARVAQVWSKDMMNVRRQPNFQMDQWERLGYRNRWEQISLQFDRRDEDREESLNLSFEMLSTKPLVLVSLSGFSAPFPDGDNVCAKLAHALKDQFQVVDLSVVRADKIYDLIGLMDNAVCLVTADTATLHLAQASSVPVIALVSPHGWTASTRRANHILYRRYNQVSFDEVVNSVRSTAVLSVRKLIHTYPSYPMTGDDLRRVSVAEKSWTSEKNWFPENWDTRPVLNMSELKRSSRTQLGDSRVVPFVKDVIEKGFEKAESDDDAVVLTNSDVGFCASVSIRLRQLLSLKGALYCYRFDHERIERPLSYHENLKGTWYGGLDLFAFTRRWWNAHKDEAPDMVMGCTHWDLVYRDLIKKYGGGELYGAIWHELHNSYWKQVPKTVGNIHNRSLADAFYFRNDPTQPFKLLK